MSLVNVKQRESRSALSVPSKVKFGVIIIKQNIKQNKWGIYGCRKLYIHKKVKNCKHACTKQHSCGTHDANCTVG